MERITSKLTRVLVATLFCAAAVTTASSQEKQNLIDVNALAVRGEVIVDADPDPLILELRNRLAEGEQRGLFIGIAAAEGHTLPGPGKDRICASLLPGESQACSIAVLFSVDRNRNGDLAARGATIAKADPLAARFRTMRLGPSRVGVRALPVVLDTLGFDIGMAAAERDTLPGPGKQKIHDSLSRPVQQGFSTAVTYSLDRNRNKKLAETGAAIAQADPAVATARFLRSPLLYWLGFDIATALFGDPALGAFGNTLMGPGSQKIRDSLSPTAQFGFDASVKWHQSRK